MCEFFKASALIKLDGLTVPTLKIQGDALAVRTVIKSLIDKGDLVSVDIKYYNTFERSEE